MSMDKNKYKNYLNYAYSLKEYFIKNNKSICIFVKNTNEAMYLKNELQLILDIKQIYLFPENDILPYDHFSVPEKITKKRFQILNNVDNKKQILITSIKNLFDLYPTKEHFISLSNFKVGKNISISELINVIESLNYIKKTNVENINEYSTRGGIIDLYAPIYKNPLRIEIFDDIIESIRFFNADSQLSIKQIDGFHLSKGNIVSLDNKTIELFINNWREYFYDNDERFCTIFQKIKNGNLPEGYEVYFPFFFNKLSSFIELFDDYEYLKFENLNEEIMDHEKFINDRFNDEINDSNRPLIKPCDYYTNTSDISQNIANIKEIKVNNFQLPDLSIDELIQNHEFNKLEAKKYVLLTSIQSDLEDLKNKSPRANILDNLSQISSSFNIMISDIVRPIYLIDKNTYLIHNENINNNVPIKNIDEDKSRYLEFNKVFNENEYVIHEDYGLGIYQGLEVVEANNKPSEYIKIIYANNENLYVPLNNINKISSYHKKDFSLNLDLDSLSSTKWLLKKEKAQKRSVDHAAEILDIESRRLKSFSSSLTVDSKSLIEFENDFPFTPTPDQISAFKSIKKDLSLIKPMNRVLCGDVGFGKTEVAMKAAFVSVSSNKQVIVITPSTILCDQHYDSFLKRYINFGVTVKKLNRFVSAIDKNNIINEFNLGNIDILISTHIIFNNNINFMNVGLLIIDEEHKFGIKQKNFIKDKQENIHILYLSATPIPRTMNMVFSGLKDFSFLQTAPSNRLSIKSFLKVQTNQLIKEALTREKSRGGQCFIVQNDIDKINNIENEINYLLPDFKLGIAHGKLNKKEIKKVMTEFKSGLLDGLICTTIVEMGLDIPNANTMIIINSQKFGLSQLHQLRGRIGRSDKQGYCYFLIPDIEIPKVSKTRLDSIIRNSNLGEGFLIAQEDLEIRGGGEMLGDKQSGHINSVGMSLYLSMLKEAIESNKNNIKDINLRPDVNFYDSSFISSTYLPSPIERLKVYRKLDKAESYEDIIKIKDSLIDRCGTMPNEAKNLIEDKKIQIRINNSGIKSIKSNSYNTNFYLSESINDKTLENLLLLVAKNKEKYLINKDNKFIYKCDETNSEKRRKNVNLLLDEIL